jgi:hypothetical protein
VEDRSNREWGLSEMGAEKPAFPGSPFWDGFCVDNTGVENCFHSAEACLGQTRRRWLSLSVDDATAADVTKLRIKRASQSTVDGEVR